MKTCEPPSNMARIKELTSKLVNQQTIIKTIVDASPDPITAIDSRGNIIFRNNKFVDCFGDIANIFTIVYRDDIDDTLSHIEASCNYFDNIMFTNRCLVDGKYSYFQWNIKCDSDTIVSIIRQIPQECVTCENASKRTCNKCR